MNTHYGVCCLPGIGNGDMQGVLVEGGQEGHNPQEDKDADRDSCRELEL